MVAERDIYLVVGGDTYVGRHVVERLKARGDDVSVLDSTQKHDDVPFYAGDIRNKADVAQVLQKVSAFRSY